jgi:hypothetical protein
MTSWLALLRMHSLSGRQEDLAACLAAAAQVMDFHLTGAGAGAVDRAAVPQVREGAALAVSCLRISPEIPVRHACMPDLSHVLH